MERKPPLPGLSCARVFSISLFPFRSEKKSLLRRLTITLSSSQPLSILGEILHLKLTASAKLNSTNHKLIRKFLPFFCQFVADPLSHLMVEARSLVERRFWRVQIHGKLVYGACVRNDISAVDLLCQIDGW